MSRIGWRNLIKCFKERMGWKHDKAQLQARYRQLKTFHTCLNKLKSGTGGGRSRGSYKATKNFWDHFTSKKEVERLKWEVPSWASMLPDMFNDVAIDWTNMLGTAAKRRTQDRDFEDTAVADSTSPPTSGSRKRGSSGTTKSTTDSPSK